MDPYDIGRLAAYAEDRCEIDNGIFFPKTISEMLREAELPNLVIVRTNIAQILAAENNRSLSWRYEGFNEPREDFISLCVAEAEREWEASDWKDHPLGHMIGTLECWRYQACEHKDFKKSGAYKLYQHIRWHMLRHAAESLGGFQWGRLEIGRAQGEARREKERQAYAA